MLKVANPIYDSAFKYLMEDMEVARTFISALLRKNVVKVEMRPNEYSNINKNGISILRIDFGATVLDDDGEEHVVLIELQKAWVETEVLRFRQYLGAQYGNPANMYSLEDEDDPRNGYGIPIVSVYLLGHKIGNVSEPIVYISRNYLNYDNEPLTEGRPDPFIESLTHDSIIVQLPLLKGQMRNQLEKLLNVFDQSRRNNENRQMLDIDETEYTDDPELQRIITRLLSAASDIKVRMSMNIEDEVKITINNRDRKIQKQEQLLREKDEQLSQKDEQLSQQKEQLNAMLETSVRLLLQNNVPADVIAANYNIPEQVVLNIAENM